MERLAYFAATRPGAAIAATMGSILAALFILPPLLAGVLAAFTVILGVTFPGMNLEPMMRLVHSLA